MPNRKVAGMA